MKGNFKKKHGGYIALMSVILIGAVGLVVAQSLLFVSWGRMNVDFSLSEYTQARAAAHSCLEEAVGQIKKNNSYTGSAGMTIGGAVCTYTVIDSGGENREIRSTGIKNNRYHRIRVLINQINPKVRITQQSVVASF